MDLHFSPEYIIGLIRRDLIRAGWTHNELDKAVYAASYNYYSYGQEFNGYDVEIPNAERTEDMPAV